MLTPQNCTTAKKYEPEQRNDECNGVGQYGDEPIEKCQRCKYYAGNRKE